METRYKRFYEILNEKYAVVKEVYFKKYKDLNKEIKNYISELIDEYGTESDFSETSSFPISYVLKIKNKEFNIPFNGTYLVEVSKKGFVSKKGYQYSFPTIDLDILCKLVDDLSKTYAKKDSGFEKKFNDLYNEVVDEIKSLVYKYGSKSKLVSDNTLKLKSDFYYTEVSSNGIISDKNLTYRFDSIEFEILLEYVDYLIQTYRK